MRGIVYLIAVATVGCSTVKDEDALNRRAAESAESRVTVKLIAFNDFHGQLSNAAALAGTISQLKSANRLNAVVAAGDLIGASPLESAVFHDEPSIEVLNAMGLEYSSVGNHEFDDGVPELKRIQGLARFEYLASNVTEAASGAPLFPPTAVKKVGSLRIGFIGAVVRSVPDLVVRDAVRGVSFQDEPAAINAVVPGLRSQGVDAIVVLIHEGGFTSASTSGDIRCPDLTGGIVPILDRLDPAIDVVVSGHTHQRYICRRDGRLVTSAGSQGRFVTDIDLTIDREAHRVVESSARQVPTKDAVKPDTKVQAIVDRYTAEAKPLADRTAAEIHADIPHDVAETGESALGDLVADAHLAATDAQIAFMNTTGIRGALRGKDGRITHAALHAVHPFGNALITITLTGAQIHDLLESQARGGSKLVSSQGFEYVWTGAAVDPATIRLNGVVIEPGRPYRITANEFLANGGDGYEVFTQGTDRVRGVLDIEALERYVTAHSPVTAPKMGRIKRSPQSSGGLDQSQRR